MLELLARREPGAEPGFKPKDVRWAIVCNDEGQYLDVMELGDTSKQKNLGQSFPRCPDLSLSELIKGGVTRSHFLVDTAEVVALLGGNPDNPRVRAKHAYFIKLLKSAGEAVPDLSRLANTLEDDHVMETIHSRLKVQKAKHTDKVTFMVGGGYPLESEAWHSWWRVFRAGLGGEDVHGQTLEKSSAKPGKEEKDSTFLRRCYVTGELIKPAVTHPKIEGLADVGGQPSGSPLIGFDKESFCSFGFSQSANAAVSESAAAAYRAGLNRLIKEHSHRLAGAKVVHWFKEKVSVENDPMAWLVEGGEEQERNAQQRARELLRSIRTGKLTSLASNYYYAITMSGAGGRVMIRDWMEGQFEDLVSNIHIWFGDLSIVHRDGGGLAPSPKFLAVLGATVRDLDDLPAPFVGKMWRVAVRNEAIPGSALAHAVMRVRVGFMLNEPANHARVGLLKAYHIRKQNLMGGKQMAQDLMPYLNHEHPAAAYHCGRLMAVLAALQRTALGDVGAGVVQRYYAAASSTPALVLGRLTRTSQFHLSKLEPGLANWYEGTIGGIWGRIRDMVPVTLSLEEQSLFALGYYQQIADMRTKKSDKPDSPKEKSNE